MGAVNYKTSDYITIGYNTNNIDYDDEFYFEFIQDEYEQIKYILEKENFYFFHVTVEPGYYEGFTIDIENNFSYCFNDYLEKLDALKETTQLKKFLIEIVNDFNMVACYPGWCTGYSDYKTTLKEINNAIRELKSEIKTTPTWYTLKKAGEF
jgi:hypothetical protein